MGTTFRIIHRGFEKVTPLFMAVMICGVLSLPAKAEAGWIEDQFSAVFSNFTIIKTALSGVKPKVENVYNKVVGAAGTITDGKIQNLINDMKVMLQAAVNAQQNGVDAFLMGQACIQNDGTPCGNFRADLIAVIHLARALNNKILALHNIPGLNIQIQDLGLADLVDKLPGRVLLPLYRVVTATQLLTPELIAALQNVDANIQNLKTVLFVEEFPAFPTTLEACQFVDENSKVFKISANTIKGIGLIVKVLGKLFEALGKTPAGGPNEVDAGIHGYVHATVKTNTLGTIGKILGGIASPLDAVSSFVSNKVSSCGDMVRDAEFKAQHVQILTNQSTLLTNQGSILQAINDIDPSPDLTQLQNNQTTIMQNQEAILRGQRETLCAYKNNLPEQCTEFVGNGYDNHGKGN